MTPTTWRTTTRSEAETETLGRLLAEFLQPGLVIGLVGPLGAGKTQLVKAVASGLGVPRDDVNSPTFVLIQEYPGRLPLYHFDAYRVGDVEEFLELGVEELMSAGGVCLIEWANRFAEVMPADALWVEIGQVSPTDREWKFQGTGELPERIIAELRANWPAPDPSE